MLVEVTSSADQLGCVFHYVNDHSESAVAYVPHPHEHIRLIGKSGQSVKQGCGVFVAQPGRVGVIAPGESMDVKLYLTPWFVDAHGFFAIMCTMPGVQNQDNFGCAINAPAEGNIVTARGFKANISAVIELDLPDIAEATRRWNEKHDPGQHFLDLRFEILSSAQS